MSELPPVTPDEIDFALPEHFPTIAVSVALGNALQPGQRIDIDPASLNKVLIGEGLPPEELDTVKVTYGKAKPVYLDPKRGRANPLPHDPDYKYGIDILLSKEDLKLQRPAPPQTHITHESKHVSDYSALGPDALQRRKLKNSLKALSIYLPTSLAGAWLPSPYIQEHIIAQDLPLSASLPLFLGSLGITAWGGALVGANMEYRLVYKRDTLERRAYEAQKHADRYPLVMQITNARIGQPKPA
ncbi:MAG TPA: hypothetical protein VMY99_05015 [Nevskiaceae bacterium]|nr:hypothetical protein [Nevskiaceae bacterium]